MDFLGNNQVDDITGFFNEEALGGEIGTVGIAPLIKGRGVKKQV